MMTDSSLATPTILLQCGRPKRRRRAARSPSSDSNASRGAAYHYKRPMRRGARTPSAASLARPGAYCGAAFCQGNLRLRRHIVLDYSTTDDRRLIISPVVAYAHYRRSTISSSSRPTTLEPDVVIFHPPDRPHRTLKNAKTIPPVYVFKLISSFLILHKPQLDDETTYRPLAFLVGKLLGKFAFIGSSLYIY